MQTHTHHLDVDGTPEEVWSLFWYRGPRPADLATLAGGNAAGTA